MAMNRRQKLIEERRQADISARELEEVGAGRDDIDYSTDELPTLRIAPRQQRESNEAEPE